MKLNSILCLALILSARIVRAQPVLRTYRSLEARVAEAHSIFRGAISSCSGTFIERQGGYFGGYKKDGTKRPDGFMKYAMTVQVEETIKGRSVKTIELVQQTFADDPRFEQWAARRTPFLWFFGDSEWSNLGGNLSETNHWSTIRLGEAVPADHDFSSDNPVYLMDFTCLINAKAILAQTRRESAKRPSDGPLKLHKLGEIPGGPLWSSLVVPVQPSLQKIAKHLITAPEDFVPANETHDSSPVSRWQLARMRADGVDALRYFKSAANIKLLESLLQDPDFYLAGSQDATVKQYPVRAKAHEVLTTWGIDVPKPITEEPVLAKDRKP